MSQSDHDAISRARLWTYWRHKKSGHVVFIVGECRLEASNEPAFLYVHDGICWARSKDKFLDGCFEPSEFPHG